MGAWRHEKRTARQQKNALAGQTQKRTCWPGIPKKERVGRANPKKYALAEQIKKRTHSPGKPKKERTGRAN
jgi:hypothetical protein